MSSVARAVAPVHRSPLRPGGLSIPPTRVQCSRCKLILLGPDAGDKLDHRDRDAAGCLCHSCWRNMSAELLAAHPEAGDSLTYQHEHRRVTRGPVRIPAYAMRDPKLAPAMAVYAELYLRGAGSTWVAATHLELADALGFHFNSIETATKRLRDAGVLQMRRYAPNRPTAYRLAIAEREEVA